MIYIDLHHSKLLIAYYVVLLGDQKPTPLCLAPRRQNRADREARIDGWRDRWMEGLRSKQSLSVLRDRERAVNERVWVGLRLVGSPTEILTVD